MRDLKCEYRTNPLGIDVTKPRLSWKLDSAERGAVQTAYQILVSSTEDALGKDQGDLWDSGKVTSDQSVHIVYSGKSLQSRQRCFWKVRTWDKRGQASQWSKPAFWSMGLLDASDWKAKWIGLDGGENPDHFASAQWIWCPEERNQSSDAQDKTRYFRRVVELPPGREISGARLTIATQSQFSVIVNGVKVVQGARTIFAPTSEIDIERHLHAGANTLAIAALAGGNKDEPSRMICAFSAEFESGAPLVVASDEQWKSSSTKIDGWEKPGFDDSEWASAKICDPPKDKVRGDDFRRLPARMLRRELNVDRKIRRATAYMCGLGLSELYINGAKVGNRVLSPGLTDYNKRSLYVTCDVTSSLKSGANAIGVVLGNGRYFAPRQAAPTSTVTYGYPKLLLQMEIEYADGSSATVLTDESWKLTDSGPIRENNEYDGEVYDARKRMDGWSKPGFDDSSWQPARPVDGPKGVLSSEMAEPIRVMDRLQPVAISSPRPGVYIFDMGQNMVGWCRLRVKGPRGTRVYLKHAEKLTSDGELYLANLRSAKVTDQYVLSGKGDEVYEPRFIYHGFRYVEVTGYPGKPDLSSLEGAVVHDALDRAGEFSCSNPLINRIYHNIYWGIRGNYRSIPTDCPQRDERQGWFGDRAQVSKGEMYVFDTAALQTKWLRDIGDSQLPDGSIPDLAPAYWLFYTNSVTFPTAAFAISGHVYSQYGDLRILETHYDSMKRWIDMMTPRLVDGIMPDDTYGDWCVPPESLNMILSADPNRVTNKQLVSTAYFYGNLRMLAQYASIVGKTNDSAHYDAIAEKIRLAFNAKFLNEAAGVYDNGTQTSGVLPLAFGMVPEEHRQRVLASLVDNIVTKSDCHIGTGMIGCQWLMRVLSDNGRPDVAYRLASQTSYPSWGYMVNEGATTIWELWNGDHGDPLMNSGNHVMQIGDLCTWLHEYVAGIAPDPAKPGFKQIIMRPQVIGDLTSARATHESPYGTIVSDWKIKDGEFTWHIEVPANTSATISIPTSDAKTIIESGKPAASADGAKLLRLEGDRAVFEVGSGVYSFSSMLGS